MKTKLFIAIILIFQFTAYGQPTKPRPNKAHVKRIKQDLQRDTKELKTFKRKLSAFKLAVNSKKSAEIKKLKTSLLDDMKREIEQGKAKLSHIKKHPQQDRKGTYQDEKDEWATKRPENRNPKHKQPPRKGLILHLNRQRAILKNLTNFHYTAQTSKKKVNEINGLLNEFVKTMELDIKAMQRKTQKHPQH